MNDPAITFEGLSKSFRRKGGGVINAVDGLTFSIPQRSIFGLLGPNGAGKTTAIKMICGLVNPSAGRVLVGGLEPRKSRGPVLEQIGALLEGSRNVYWPLTAWQNLMYFARLKGKRGPEIVPRATELLTELGLWTRRNDPVRQLSRGMQQKVAIACALVADPRIILLDEPTLGLDAEATATMKRWIKSQVREKGKTVVLTSHQVDLVEELCDEVAVIKQGRLVACQSTADLVALFSRNLFRISLVGRHPHLQTGKEGGVAVEVGEVNTVLTVAGLAQGRVLEIVAELNAAGHEILSLQKDRPSLEEIFVKLVGESGAQLSLSK
jgi:ABC-2 type transport system ATP-binding protein